MCAPEEPCFDPCGRGLEACFGPKPIFIKFYFSWDSGGLSWPWGASVAAELAGSEMKEIVEAALDRVDAEMPDTDLVCAFGVFDLQTWQRVRWSRGDPAKMKTVETVMSYEDCNDTRVK